MTEVRGSQDAGMASRTRTGRLDPDGLLGPFRIRTWGAHGGEGSWLGGTAASMVKRGAWRPTTVVGEEAGNGHPVTVHI